MHKPNKEKPTTKLKLYPANLFTVGAGRGKQRRVFRLSLLRKTTRAPRSSSSNSPPLDSAGHFLLSLFRHRNLSHCLTDFPQSSHQEDNEKLLRLIELIEC
ncbi:hypothetical protein Droror1_Dr00002869 [Drosera rotundifolia]